MSERDRGMAIAMLAEAFAVRDLTPARIRIYEQALQKVPVPVLNPMVQRAVQTRQFFPRVAELLEDAEACRKEMLGQLAFAVCPMNENCSPLGFTEREIDGVKRMVRCACWQRHQDQIQALGVGHEPLALPAPEREMAS